MIGDAIRGGGGKTETRSDGVTVIHEVKLFEISLTAVPANQGARVFEVRSLRDARRLLAGLQTSELEQEDAVPELKAIETELRRLLAAVEPPKIDAGILRDLKELAATVRA